MSEGIRQRIIGLSETLNAPNIDLRKLRAYMADGVPDEVPLLR